MVVKTTQLPESINPGPISLVQGPECRFNMLSTLRANIHSDFQVICQNHTFNVHTVVVERKCTYFKSRANCGNA